MILPIVSAISREVVATVPPDLKEAALALGATRWEMIRIAVLPYSRSGIVGASMLGLGRAIGETIAVTLVIGNAPTLGKQLFDQGYTLAAVIANEFGEAGQRQAALRRAHRRRPRPLRPDPRHQRGRPRPRHSRRAALERAAAGRGRIDAERDRLGRCRRMSAVDPLAPVTGRRRRSDVLARGTIAALTFIALIPLVLVVYYLLKRGLGALDSSFFTSDPTGNFLGDQGGVRSAIFGTIEMVALATAHRRSRSGSASRSTSSSSARSRSSRTPCATSSTS